MVKKISVLLISDIALALVIFTKAHVKNFIFSSVTQNTNSDKLNSMLSGNNWASVIALVIAGIIIAIVANSKTTAISHMLADIFLLGLPGLAIACWWKVLEVSGWGYFCNYQEMMAYIGAIMFGTCIYKVIKYIFNRNG
ncbi:MAG: hypothetical protein IJV39_06490 [Ruminococcus sp.]|nr:hypothetical protein [Ruminococcus sp.]